MQYFSEDGHNIKSYDDNVDNDDNHNNVKNNFSLSFVCLNIL